MKLRQPMFPLEAKKEMWICWYLGIFGISYIQNSDTKDTKTTNSDTKDTKDTKIPKIPSYNNITNIDNKIIYNIINNYKTIYEIFESDKTISADIIKSRLQRTDRENLVTKGFVDKQESRPEQFKATTKGINELETIYKQQEIKRLEGQTLIATKADYRRVVKQFYKWFIEEDIRLNNPHSTIDELTIYKIAQGDISKAEVEQIMEQKRNAELQKVEAEKFYKYVKELKRAYKLTEIDPAEVISEEEVNILCDKGCKTFKEKAFVWLLHETGARIGEFLNIKLKDLNIKGDFIEVNLDGKTGKRTVYCYNSFPFLLKYLEVHQDKDNNNSYLWLSDNNRNRGARLNHIGGVRILERVFSKSNINKKHNPHWFRHSRASILAPKITEPILRKYMGWSKSSQMIKHYGHLCLKDIQDVILNLHGLKEEKQIEKPIKCICGTINPIHERYCYKCMRPLKMEIMMQDQELIKTETAKTIGIMMEMLKDPAKMKAFEDFKRKKTS